MKETWIICPPSLPNLEDAQAFCLAAAFGNYQYCGCCMLFGDPVNVDLFPVLWADEQRSPCEVQQVAQQQRRCKPATAAWFLPNSHDSLRAPWIPQRNTRSSREGHRYWERMCKLNTQKKQKKKQNIIAIKLQSNWSWMTVNCGCVWLAVAFILFLIILGQEDPVWAALWRSSCNVKLLLLSSPSPLLLLLLVVLLVC